MPVVGDVPGVSLKVTVLATHFSEGFPQRARLGGATGEVFSCPLIVAHAFTLSQAAMEIEASELVRSQQR